MTSSRRVFCALHVLVMLGMICYSQGTSKTFIKSDIVELNLPELVAISDCSCTSIAVAHHAHGSFAIVMF